MHVIKQHPSHVTLRASAFCKACGRFSSATKCTKGMGEVGTRENPLCPTTLCRPKLSTATNSIAVKQLPTWSACVHFSWQADKQTSLSGRRRTSQSFKYWEAKRKFSDSEEGREKKRKSRKIREADKETRYLYKFVSHFESEFVLTRIGRVHWRRRGG